MTASGPRIEVVNDNVLNFKCDVLVLKYAQAWHGADLAVAKNLNFGPFWDAPHPGEYRTAKPDPASKIMAPLLVFIGCPPFSNITYKTIRDLGKTAITTLDVVAPNVRHIAMTMHGVNFGMDEKESFLAQIAGMLGALDDDSILSDLELISIVEFKKDRAERLAILLHDNQVERITRSAKKPDLTRSVAQAGLSTKEKPHIFVAMPFTDDMEDVYTFGILGPVQDAGLLCERVDMDVFTGDILDRIKSRIGTAALVIADLTGSNANVYLEVGYAWGCHRKTLLLCKIIDDLKFDVKGQRCLIYSSIRDLNKKLTEELRILIK